jgi:predicted DNA-binding transcriptional regulator YafY
MDMAARAASPTERILDLAAYLKARRGTQITLSDVTRDVPGYDDGTAPRDDRGELEPDVREWETLRKKVARDLDDLAEQWGIHADWDEADRTYALRPAFFLPEERAALIAAAATVDVRGPSDEHLGDLGTAVDDDYAAVVVRVPELVMALRDACATGTPVRFRHGGQERVLEPWALGQWQTHWYVAGWCPDSAAMRRYRLDRIDRPLDGDAITPAGEPDSFSVPDWFRADLAFDMDPNSWGHDPPLHARFRVGLDHLPVFLREIGGRVEARADDHAVVALTVRHHQWTRDRVLGLRGNAVPLAPPELVALVRDHLSAIVAAA